MSVFDSSTNMADLSLRQATQAMEAALTSLLPVRLTQIDMSEYLDNNSVYNVLDQHARRDGSVDSTQAFRDTLSRLIDDQESRGGTDEIGGRASIFKIPGGHYRVKDLGGLEVLDCTKHRVKIIGDGQQATVIEFNPDAPATCFKMGRVGNEVLNQGTIKGVGFASGGSNIQRTAIELIDTSIFQLRDIGIVAWAGVGSVGIRTRGREFLWGENIQITCDRPIVFSPNPHLSAIGLDHTYLNKLYLIPGAGNKGVEIEPGCYVSSLVIDGAAIATGKWGFYWSDPAAAQYAQGVVLRNFRTEQMGDYFVGGDGTGYGVYVDAPVNNMHIHKGELGHGSRGFYFRQVNWLSLDHCSAADTAKALLDIDMAADGGMNVVQVKRSRFFPGGTANLANAREVYRIASPDSGPVPFDATYVRDFGTGASASYPVQEYGVRPMRHKVAMVAGAQVQFPASVTNGYTHGRMVVMISSATQAQKSATFLLRNGVAPVMESGDVAVFDIINTPSRFCLVVDASTTLINNLAGTVDVMVSLEWY